MHAQPPAMTLPDMLPQGAADRAAGEFRVPLGPALRGLVEARIRSECGPNDWLCAALAWVEARLTGADEVVATGFDRGQCRQATVAVRGQREPAAWCASVIEQLVPVADVAQPLWAVAMDHAALPDCAKRAALAWTLDTDRGDLVVRHADSPGDEAARLLAECVLRVLAAMLAGSPLEALELLDADARRLQLVDWNRTAVARDGPDTVHGCFERMRRAAPASVAVVDGRQSHTYAELGRRADALALRLREAGVRTGDIVAVMLPRSADVVVAVLAILKAGAAYLPVEPAHPVERVHFVLQDAAAQVAVVAASDARLPAAIRQIQVDSGTVAAVPEVQCESAVDGESLAYVMYTLGSTGEPKGVEIPHRAILRLVCGVDYIETGPGMRMLHAAPLGFDASTLELWAPLLTGGAVVVHDEATPSAEGLAATIGRHGVTTAWLTAALFNTIVDADPRHLAGLHELFTGGEALSVEHVRRLRRAVPGLRLRNGYGPTECTTFTCTHPIDVVEDDCGAIPLGRPIADTRVYVLNARCQPIPVGMVGELYVGGAGLARGYLQRPELTHERFVPDPFVSGERLYRTGDLVRYRADGVIEFIGRADAQVKIRGFRIEPGEIEAVLARHPGVLSCAVVAVADRSGGKRLVAYFVEAGDGVATPVLRAHVAASLPEFMVPARYIRIDAILLTANGKLDRAALPLPDRSRPELANGYEAASGDDEARICAVFADLLDVEHVGRNDNFFELGGNSLLAQRALERLRDSGSDPLAATMLFAHPTPAALAAALKRDGAQALQPARIARPRHQGGRPAIAIVAMAARLPGACSVEAFWRNLCEGRDAITHFADAGLDPAVACAERADASYVRARGVIEGVDLFDAAFFGISPREAELMDPQQRIFLELCWECLERGGYAPDATPGPVGVFAGMYNATYFQRHVAAHPEQVARLGAFQTMLGNEKDYIATRVAHKLNLTGPAVSIQTACSTSLVAICQAMASLQAGGCDMALAGGVAVTCPPRSGYLYQEGGMLSPDGRTRSFDKTAQGTVFSDGAAVLLLKRLSDAIADGDAVYAVLRGGAINNDGGHKASFTAPNSEGQAAVIAQAHADAGIDPRSIGYVEAHGTATPLGDPIEIEGLTRAFRLHTADTGFCRIGSVKSNIGHTVMAAGAAGVIKTALALHEGRIPGTAHFECPNPVIDFAGSPFMVHGEMVEWPRGAVPRRAGVSSFGVGGTNAHVVMEEAPCCAPGDAGIGPQLLALSARTPAALQAAMTRLADHLEAEPGQNLADVAWTLMVGRTAFAHRMVVVADAADTAAMALRDAETQANAARTRAVRQREVVFMFPGQGATYAGMGRALHAAEPAFRAAFDECTGPLQAILGEDLRDRMFGDDPQALLPTAIMQPATFVIEYALARWWMSHGIRPAAMIGHSVGEFVAATLAGVFTVGDALRLVAARGALMQAQPAGAMLSVRLPADTLVARMPVGLSLAAENAPGACVVAGPTPLVAAFQACLEGEGVACRMLATSHAFHSAMMEPVVAPFLSQLAATPMRAPGIPLVSTATGDWLGVSEATSAAYWARHLREPVRFSTAIGRVLDETPRILLEVGPRATLCGLARQHPAQRRHDVPTIASLADQPEREWESLRLAAGRLWGQGTAIDLVQFDHRQARRRVRLPSYPFERQRHWLDAAPASAGTMPVAAPIPANATSEPVEGIRMPATHESRSIADDRQSRLLQDLREVFENIAGFDLSEADPETSFIELGLDSLMLTQVALQLQKQFDTKLGFRQLMGEASSLVRLAAWLDAQLPPESVAMQLPAASAASPVATSGEGHATAIPVLSPDAAAAGEPEFMRQLINQQMQLMAQQLALLSGAAAAPVVAGALPAAPATTAAVQATPGETDEEAALAHTRYDVRKAFGAIARIHDSSTDLGGRQKARLEAFIGRYVARTRRSKQYTEAHRPHLADPRVVNGFRPLLKEITYQLVVERSRGSRVWDVDGNEYVDALNGFGMNLFGWQPEFVVAAVKRQLELGYEIGPQHPLAGEVAKSICELTGFDRAALCNTGSEAVLGTIRIARTVTGRNTLVIFSGSYHGIFDEVIVRGTRKLRSVPAAPGILRNTVDNVLVLEYGTRESLQVIRERAHEIAAVLVEPVQSRRPDFQPREFLKELRAITREAGALLIFDEVVTGFRADPRGARAVLDIDTDLASYGKVVGGGFPIGVIAGRREYMDALDGGHWKFGDDSTPTVGVTYFAGTFVRHPLALAAAKAVLGHLKDAGPSLQQSLNARTTAFAAELNAFCAEVGAPIEVKHFASVWKTAFTEDHPLQDLLFAMMRSRGIHILDHFPCFFTTAHSEADFAAIAAAFRESVLELQEAEFIPRRHAGSPVADASQPPVSGARLGRDASGNPAWFAPHPQAAGKFVKVGT